MFVIEFLKTTVPKDGTLASLGYNLTYLYFEYQDFLGSGTGAFDPSNSYVNVIGDSVVIDARADGDVVALRDSLEVIGLRVTGTYGPMISGLLPINAIPYAAGLGSLGSLGASAARSSVGVVTSQGDAAQHSDDARANFTVNGAGVTVGVLSDSYNTGGFVVSAAADVANGDLPGVGNPNGFTTPVNVLDDSFAGGSDEGRGMLQIVHDVAPGAALSFHTAFTGQAAFAQGIIDLAAAGADVIVDDVFYFAEPFFQDGIIAQAVDTVAAAGVSYFSSAGNQARQSYESGFVSSGVSGNGFVNLHDFNPGGGTDAFQQITIPAGGTLTLFFQWDEPFGASTSDVDIYLLDADNVSANVLASGENGNVGGDPFEFISYTAGESPETVHLAIDLFSGPAPGLMKYIYLESSVTINQFATNSAASFGHSQAVGATAVGAAFYLQTPEFGQTPPLLESFSSAGGNSILFDTAGTRLAMAEIRNKPEITAPDGAETSFFGQFIDFAGETPGLPNFFGTSAAAPHAAGGAALLLQAKPSLSPTEIRTAFTSTAINIGPAGFDFESGAGLIDVNAALGFVGPLDYGDAPSPYPTLFANDGARHTATGPRLGNARDSELEGQPNATATGDGADEDGISFPTTLFVSSNGTTMASVEVDLQNADATSNFLDAWIDFNQDGDWSDLGEKIISSADLGTMDGLQTVSFTIPQDAMPNTGITFARFRLSTTGGLNETGFSAAGEVEDYAVTLVESDAGGMGTVDLPAGGGGFTVDVSGGQVRVLQGGQVIQSTPLGDNNALVINGTDAGDDTLTLDLSNGSPIPAGGLVFNGGMGGDDMLQVLGGTATDVVYAVSPPGAGNGNGTLSIDGADIAFTGLEPLLVTVMATTVTIDLSGLAAGEELTLQDVGANNDMMSQVNFVNNNLEDITFANPTGSFVIIGSDMLDTFHINALDTLDNTGAALSATLTVDAGSGNDIIDFNAKTSSGTYTFNGEGGSDELQGRDANQTWNITGADAGNIGGLGVVDFTSIQNLTGGTGDDRFNIATGTSISGAITGGNGNDTLDIDGSGTVNTFNGGNNTDTIDEADVTTVVATLTTAISGTITNITNPYTSVEALIGNDTDSTLNLPNSGSIVSITGMNDGTVMNGGTMNFTDFNVVVFGDGDDDITFLAGASLTSNTINGGLGDDTLTVDFTGNVPLAAGTLNWEGGDEVGDNDALVITGYNFTAGPFANGAADVTVNHLNDGDPTNGDEGNVTVGPVGTLLGTINFIEIEPLILAGSAADVVINLPVGTANTDVLFADDTAANFGANGNNLANRSAIDASTFEYTEFVNPTNTLVINLGDQGDTITILSLDGNYVTAGPSAGTTIQGGTGDDVISFALVTPAATNIDLLGGLGDDLFDIDTTLTGEVDGQANTIAGDTLAGDAIDLVTLTGGNADGFAGDEASITAGFNGIETITANAAANSRLTGRDDASTWTLNIGGVQGRYDDSDVGVTGTPQLRHNNFDTLQGGTQSDLFLVTVASTFNLNGGDGVDNFDIDAALAGTIQGGLGVDTLQGDLITAVTLTGSVAADGYAGNEADINGGANSFIGINVLLASTAVGVDALLMGRDLASTWTLDGAPRYNDGTGNGTVSFVGFETLSGGTAIDSFLVTVDPDDGQGTDGTTLFGNDGADVFQLDVAFLGQVFGGGVGPATDLDVLQGIVIDNVVLVSSDNEGFNGTENSITTTPVGMNGFNGIDTINATTTVASRLTGRDVGGGSTWTIAGAGSSYTDGTRTLVIDTDFDSLQGGNDSDTFNITANSDFDLFGGDGSDTFNVIGVGTVLTGSIDGEGANDLLQGTGIDDVTLVSSAAGGEFSGLEGSISGGFARIGTINGTTAGTGILRGEDAGTSTWTLNGVAPTYADGTSTLNFSLFGTLQGRGAVDNFTVTGVSDFNLNGGGNNDTFTLNAALNAGRSINGEDGIDTLTGATISVVGLTAAVTGNGFSGTETDIPGGFLGINTLVGTNSGTLTGFSAGGTSAIWTLTGDTATYADSASGEVLNLNDGAIAGVVTPGFTILQGGGGIDTFNVNASTTVELSGNGGADVFNLTDDDATAATVLLTGNISGGDGVDSVSFTNNTANLSGNIDGGLLGASINFNATTTGVDVTISGAGVSAGVAGDDSVGFVGGTFTNITTIIGEAGVGNLFNGATSGTFNFGATATYTTGGGMVTFSQFEEAHGGSGNDTFNVSAAPAIPLFGGDGDDALAVDFAAGAFDVTFDGEEQATVAGDNLTVANNTFATLDYTVTAVGEGNLVFAGATVGDPNGTITFTGLEPVTVTSALGTVTITIDPAAFAGTITTNISSAAGVTTVDFDNGLEDLVFTNPTVALIFIGDNAETDIINVNSMVGFTAALTIDAGADVGDVISVTSDLALGSATSTGDLTLTAETINLSAASIRTDNVAAAGSVTLDATTINIDANLTIDTNNGTDGILDVVTSRIDAVAGGAQSLTLDLGDSSFADNNAVANDYSTVAITSANDVTLTETNTINLGTVLVTGTLTGTANGLVDFTGGASTVGLLDINTNNAGAITDTAGTLVVTGTATLSAGALNNITLNNANNFSTVVLVDGLNVTLNDTGAITLSTFAGTSDVTGNLSVTAAGLVDFSGPGTTTVGGTLSITTTAGGITDSDPTGILAVTGTATLAAGAANNITLNNVNNTFSTVAITSGLDVILVDADAINLGTSAVSGFLNVTSGGLVDFTGAGASTVGTTLTIATTVGGIDDSGTGTLTVTGTATLAAGATNDITLNNANNFNTVVLISGRDVTLSDTGAINLGNAIVTEDLSVTAGGLVDFTGAGASTVGGTLGITTTAGGITDTGAGSLTVTGLSTLAAGAANNITLDNVPNDFSTVIITSGNNVTLRDTTDIDLGASTVSGALSVTTGGNITESGALIVQLTTTLAATNPNSDILLNTQANNLTGAVSFGGTLANIRDVALRNVNAAATVPTLSTLTSLQNLTINFDNANVVLPALTTTNGGNLVVTSGGAVGVTNAALVTVAGTSTLTTTTNGADIVLNPFASTGAVTLNTVGAGGNATLVSAGAISFGGTSTVNGDLAVTAVGITQDVTGVLTVTGTTSLTAGAANNITLGNANNFGGDVTIVSGLNVTLNDTGAISFGGLSTISGNLIVTAAGLISGGGAAGTLAVTGTTSLTAGAGNSITLDNGNNFGGDVTIVSGMDVTLNDTGAISFGGVSTISGNLIVTATGLISDGAAGTLAITGTTSLTAGAANSITLDNANNFGGDVTIVSGLNVTLSDTDAISFGGVSTISGNLVVTSAGSISDGAAGTLAITGTASLTAGAGNSIMLDNANNFGGDVTIVSGLNVTLNDTGAISFGGVSTISGNLMITAAGLISDGAAGTLAITGTSSLTAGAGNSITLDNANNFGGDVTIVSGLNVTLSDTGAISFGGVSTISGNLIVTAAGLISDGAAGTLAITGTTSLTAGAGNSITLDNGNNFGGDVTIVSGLNVTLSDTGAISFGGVSTISGNLVVTSAGLISDGAAGTLAITGTTSLTAGAANSITLDNANNFGGAVTVVSANNVTLVDVDSLSIASITAAGTVAATARGNDNTLAVSGAVTAVGTVAFNADKMAFGIGATVTAAGVGSTVTLLPFNNGELINLGSGTDLVANTLELSNAEIGGISAANLVVGNTNSGAITVSAAVTTAVTTLVTITTGINNNVAFGATGQLNTGAANLTLALDANGVGAVLSSSGAASDITTTLLTINAGQGGIGVSGNPLFFDATTLVTSSGVNGTQFLREMGSVTWNSSSAGIVGNRAAITLEGGTFNVGAGQTITVSTLTVGTGATLGGTGIIAGNVTSTGTGIVGPGTSPGILTINGNYTPGATGVTAIELTSPDNLYDTVGTDFDQLIVNGTVNLNGSTLTLTGGAVAGAPGTIIPILLNDGVDAITGTFNGLADGTMVTVGGVFMGFISYFGGDGNDVTLTVASVGPAIINDIAANNGVFEIRQVGETIQVLRGGVVVDSRPIGAVAAGYTINGLDGNDSLLVNFGATGGIFNIPITFNGGAQTIADSLTVSGGTFDSLEYDVTGSGAGTLTFENVLPANDALINFTGLEPVTVTSAAGTVIIDIDPTNTFNGTTITTTLADAAGANMTVSFTAGAESLTFANPTVELQILGDNNGDNDIITVNTVDAAFTGALTLNGRAGTADTINLPTSLLLGSTTSSGNVAFTAETINLGSGAAAINIATDGDVTNNDAGTVTLTATTINIDQNVTIDTNATTTDAAFTVTGAGVIDAVAGTARTLTLDVGTTDVMLNNANNFGTVLVTSATNVMLVDANTIDLGASTIAGTLAVTASGLISDSGTVVVTGTSTFAAGAANNITLDTVTNNFSTVVITSGLNVILRDTNAIDLGASTVSGTLSVTTTNGAITDSGNLAVTGNANFAAGGGGAITLGDAGGETTNFGTLTFTSTGAVAITEDSDTILAGTNTALSLVLTSAASITDAVNTDIAVTNNASFSGTSILIGDDVADTQTFGSLTFNSAGAVTISEDNATDLTGTNTALSLTLISAAGITDAVNTDITVTNNASFSGTSILIGDNAMDAQMFGSLTFNSAGAVTITEDDATILTGANTANGLTLTSAAGITDVADTDIAVTNNASFSGTTILIGDDAADTQNFGSLTFNSAGAVTITEDTATDLSGTSTANSLVLTSAGAITDAAASNVTVTTTATIVGTSISLTDTATTSVLAVGTAASLTATAGGITIAAAGTANFGTLTFNATGAVSITEDSDTSLAAANTALSLTLTSAGMITDAVDTDITVTNNASFNGTSILIGDDVADVQNFGTLTFNSAGAVTITEDSDTILAGTNTANGLVLTSTGTITDAATTSLTVTNNARFVGTAITLGDNAGDTTNFGTLSFTSAGDVTITEDSTMNVAGAASNTSAALTLTSQTGDVRLQDTGVANDINASGAVTINVPTNERFFISDASTNILSGGAVSIAADKMSLTGTISAAGQTVTLRPFSTTDAINLGTAGDLNSIGNTLELSDAELDLITAANLVIGNAAAATGQTITVLGVTTPANAPNVTLVTGGNSRITFFNTGSLTATGNVTLTTSAAGTGGIDSGNAVVDVTAVGLLTISTGSGGIGTLAAPLTFATGTISADTSSSNAGQFLLSTQVAPIGVVSFNAGTGTITLLDGDYTLTGNEVINNVTDITLTNPATIAMAGFTETFDALNGNGNVGGAGLLILGANNQAAASHSGVISGTMAFTKIGTGTQTLAGANNYTGQTIVNGTGGTLILSGVNTGNGMTDVLAGTLLVNGSTVSLTTVSLAGVLGGSGTINNNVTLQAGSSATFAPGSPVNTIADLAIVGNLTMNAGTTYSVNVNGATPNTQHDQVAVTGNVILGRANLVLSGTVSSLPGQEIVLIANNGILAIGDRFETVAVGATTFSGAEGTPVMFNGAMYFLSYQGGAGGNDVTLTQLGPATYSGSGELELRLVTTAIGSSVQFLDDTAIVDARPLAAVLNQLITVNGAAGTNDTLRVNYTAPVSGFFDVDVAFNGGTGGMDTLTVDGGTFTTVTHTFTATGPGHSGNIAYNTGTADATVSYTGLEPVNMIGNMTTDLTFVLPTGANTATLTDDANAGDGESLLSSAGSFENTTFTNPTGTLTITGNTGADNIVITSVDIGFDATLTVNGGSGSDTLTGVLIDVVTLTTSSAAGFNGTENSFGLTFTDFETINNPAPADGSLTGQNEISQWDLDGTPTYTTGGNTLNFSGFLTLIGGDGDDTFNVSAASTINLIGGDGADTFAFTNPVVLTGSIDGGLGNDTLVGDDDGNAFIVTAANMGTLLPNTSGGWSNVENLTGGSGVDTFVVSLGGSLQGAISGLQGDDTLDLSAVVGASATITALNADGATLSPVTSIGGGASGINVLTGQGTGTLTGEDTDRTWNLNAGATGKTYTDGLNTLTFSDFATLQGGSGADTFNVIAATTEVLNGGDGADLFDIDATLTGSVNGQGGSDTLQGTAIVNVLLTASDATGFTGTSDGITPAPGPNDFTGIDNLIGTGTLTGRNVVSIWTLNGTATYFDGTATLTVSGFSTLQGGSDRDTFNVTGASTFNLRGGAGMDLFDVAAPLTGVIAGQAGQDTLQGALIDRVVLTGSVLNDGFAGTEPDINAGVTSFSGIDTLVGNGGTLTGEDVASTWGLDGTPTYLENATNRSLGFTGFNDLQGGSMADRFNVTNASTFNLLGGAGDDVFDIDAVLTGAIAGQSETVPAGVGDVLQGDLINDVTLFGSTGEGFSGGESDVAQSFTGINTITGNGGRLLGAAVNSTWLLDGSPTYNDGSARFLNFSGFATLQGSTANDTFTVTAASPFTLLGGAGNDRFTFNGGRLTNGGFADGEAGNDTLDGTGAIAAGVGQLAGLTLNGGAGNDSITGSSLNDVLSGGEGNDSINAAAGDDTLSGGTGNNTLNGGAGTDCVTDLVIANATLTNTSLVAIGNNSLISIECVELFGNGANNLIDASGFTPGVNVPGVILHGGAGDDTLVGTSKNDQLFGDAGFDTVRFRSTTGATIVATNGMLMDGAMMDVLNSIEALNLTGHASLGTTINAAAFSGNTTLSGGSGADTLTAGQKASQLNGNAGNDLLTGGAGADLFYGGAGNDTMNGGLGNDSMRGEDGNDSMEGGVGDDRLFGDAGGDRISGGDGQDSIGGGDGNDTLIGGEGHDSIGGDSGNDLISGGNGDDRLYGDAGNDTLLGGDGSDVLSGAGGKDLLLGGAGNDRIDGGGDKDTIAGQGGNDTISGSSDEINEFFVFDFHRLLI